MKKVLLRLLGADVPGYVEDPTTLRQISEDLAEALNEIEAEYNVRLRFGWRRKQDLCFYVRMR